MPARYPVDTFRPGSVPDLSYGFGRDYAVPMMNRQAFSRYEGSLLACRESSPCRLNPSGSLGSKRPPC